MTRSKLPQTDSIEELARFWDTHDLTEFTDDLEEVTEPVFDPSSRTVMVLRLAPPEVEVVKRSAEERGVEPSELLREWVLEKLGSISS